MLNVAAFDVPLTGLNTKVTNVPFLRYGIAVTAGGTEKPFHVGTNVPYTVAEGVMSWNEPALKRICAGWFKTISLATNADPSGLTMLTTPSPFSLIVRSF